MKSLDDQFDIRLFSHLIEIILWCRLNKKTHVDDQIQMAIKLVQSVGENDRVDLNLVLQMISKLHEGSDFKVNPMLRRHFLSHVTNKYCISLQIFTLRNKTQLQHKSGGQQKDKLIEKWIFRKQLKTKGPESCLQLNYKRSDLIQKVLTFLRNQNEFQNQENNGNKKISINTAHKGYQLVIQSQCPNKKKNLFHVLHLQKNISQVQIHRQSLKSSLLQLPHYWQKSLKFPSRECFFVGCYFYKPFQKCKNPKIQSLQSEVLHPPDRKMSSETKAEQKQSTCSIKFSLENISFRQSGKRFKQSSDVQLIRKTSQEIANNYRPRYQSIYQSKDEEMNIFILSPRKLSKEQSPKLLHLQQKTLQLQITEHRGISEEMIEEFLLEPDELMSNGSSEGFQMLQENDQLDFIQQEKSQQSLEKEEKQRARKRKEAFNRIRDIQNQVILYLRSFQKGLTAF